MKNTFGKGLESLIPKKSIKVARSSDKKEAVFYIEIEKIKPNPYQPRKEFNMDALQSLSDSIKEYGVLQPLVVSRSENKENGSLEYQLIAGERRSLAAKMAGLTSVPVIIREPTEKEKLEISVVENVQRLNLNAMEKAEAYKQLKDEFSYTPIQISKLVGASRPAVSNLLRLLDLSEEIKQAIREDKISEGHARAILMARNPKEQNILFKRILKERFTVRQTEAMAQKSSAWQPQRKTLKFLQEYKDIEKEIRNLLGIDKVKIGTEIGQLKLTVFFKSKEELENLLKKIKEA